MSDNVVSQSKDKPVLAGSVFINNTSYSGCDIKVVVMIYDIGKTSKEYANQANTSSQDTSKQISTLTGQLSSIETKLNQVHTGTSEHTILTKQKSKIKKQLNQLEGATGALGDHAQKLTNSQPKATTKVLAEVQTLSASTHRDKQAVRACGSVYPKGFTRGPREIAGSLIFTVFNEHVLYEFLEADASDFDSNVYTSALIDQLPPVDILVSFANEYGQTSRMTIYGVEFVNEGQVMSIEDILTENVVNFVARDLDPMRSVSARKLDENSIMTSLSQPKRASDLLLEEDYKAVKESIDPFARFKRRRNPFL